LNGINTSAIYISQAGNTNDALAIYLGGGALTNVVNYWQGSGNIASRGMLELGSTSGADCLTWDSYQVQAKTAFNGNSSQGGVLVSGSLLAYAGSADSYIFRGNTSFYQSASNTHNAFGISLTPTFTGTVNYTAIELRANQGKGLYQVGATPTNHLQGSTIIGDTITPAQTFHVTGTARITGSDGTGTHIMLRDADGDISNATLGSGLSITSGTLAATGVASNIYTANGTLSGARTVTLGSNTLSMTGTSGGTNQVSFSMNPSTNTNGIQSIDGSLNNATITVTPARTQIVTINTTGGTAATLEVFADSVKISPTPISLNDTLSFLIGFNSTTGRLHRVTKSTLSGLSDPGANGMLARTAANTTTARTIVAGAGMAVTNGDGVAGNPSLSLEFSEGYLSVAGGGTTVTAATPERIDADSPGTATSSILGTEFSVSGSTIDWTGADDSMMKISGTVSFSISDNTDMKVSIYKEGVELAVTEVRVTMVAGDYHTVHLPEIHTAADDNDTFAVYVEPISGTTTTTVHKSHISIKKLY
jgi:hypothetical protein